MRRLAWSGVLGAVLIVDVAVAQEVKFNDTTRDGKWETAANWSNGQIPGTNNQVRFSGTRVGTLSTVSTITAIQINVGSLRQELIIASGGSLTATGGWNGIGAGSLFKSGTTGLVTIAKGGSLTVTGWRNGNTDSGVGGMPILTIYGTMTTTGTSNFDQNNVKVEPVTIIHGGTLNIGGALNLAKGKIIINHGGKIVATGNVVAQMEAHATADQIVTQVPGDYIEVTYNAEVNKTTITSAPEPTEIPLLGLGIITSP